jgi:hypothetical protein
MSTVARREKPPEHASHITQTASAISAELMSVTDHSSESRPKKRVISMVLFPVSASFRRALNCFVTSPAERFEETIGRPDGR